MSQARLLILVPIVELLTSELQAFCAAQVSTLKVPIRHAEPTPPQDTSQREKINYPETKTSPLAEDSGKKSRTQPGEMVTLLNIQHFTYYQVQYYFTLNCFKVSSLLPLLPIMFVLDSSYPSSSL